jgi:hypothetical protein
MPFASIPAGEQASSRDRRLILCAVGAVVAALVAVGIWSAVRPGGYGGSSNGCITVSLPSSMGGSLIHQCGADARATCHRAFASNDRISRLTRPQCRLAGLGAASH